MGQDRLERRFSRVARGYDRQLFLERRSLRTAAEMVAPLAGLAVLDLATGTGALAETLIRARGGPPAEMVVADAVPEMLDRARRRLAGTGSVAMSADARRLPWRERFDVVSIGFLLHLLPAEEAVAVLASCRGALRPGGRVVVAEHAVAPGLAGRVYRRLWALGGRLAPGAIGAPPYEDGRPLFAPAGLDVLEERRHGGGYPTQVVLARRPDHP